jgi:serine/threonine protein kinase
MLFGTKEENVGLLDESGRAIVHDPSSSSGSSRGSRRRRSRKKKVPPPSAKSKVAAEPVKPRPAPVRKERTEAVPVVSRVLHAYTARKGGELTLIRGDVLINCRKVKGAWWSGERLAREGESASTAEKGLYPATCVHRLGTEEGKTLYHAWLNRLDDEEGEEEGEEGEEEAEGEEEEEEEGEGEGEGATGSSKTTTSSSSAPSSSSRDLALPDTITKILDESLVSFDRERVLGSGGAAEVYAGVLEPGGRPVAVKVFDKMNNYKELELMTSLSHPNIVECFGIVPQGRMLPLAVMERMHCSLREYIKATTAPLPHSTFFRFCLHISAAMEYLHAQEPPIFHRDLKSHNVLLTEGSTPTAKIADFGVAKGAGENNSTMIKGSFLWLAPESISTDHLETRELGKMDAFAFAVVMWELLERKLPWHWEANQIKVCMRVVKGERLPRPACVAPARFDPLWRLIEQSWAQDPAARPTFAQISTELRSLDNDTFWETCGFDVRRGAFNLETVPVAVIASLRESLALSTDEEVTATLMDDSSARRVAAVIAAALDRDAPVSALEEVSTATASPAVGTVYSTFVPADAAAALAAGSAAGSGTPAPPPLPPPAAPAAPVPPAAPALDLSAALRPNRYAAAADASLPLLLLDFRRQKEKLRHVEAGEGVAKGGSDDDDQSRLDGADRIAAQMRNIFDNMPLGMGEGGGAGAGGAGGAVARGPSVPAVAAAGGPRGDGGAQTPRTGTTDTLDWRTFCETRDTSHIFQEAMELAKQARERKKAEAAAKK